jgi:FkbM family methyltransferase
LAYVGSYDEGVIQIDTRSFIEWWIYMFGSYEGGAVDTLKSLVNDQSIVFDVGANVGVFTLPLARRSSVVHAFEPHPRLRARLSENVGLNNLRNVVVNPVALSDEVGFGLLFGASHNNQGQGSLTKRGAATEPIKCELTTLDQYVRSSDLDRVDLIKIDVEGAEFRVLQGASETLTRLRPTLYLEINPAFLEQAGSSAKEVGEFLAAHGYAVWRNKVVERRMWGERRNLQSVDTSQPSTSPGDQYWLAVPPDCDRQTRGSVDT